VVGAREAQHVAPPREGAREPQCEIDRLIWWSERVQKKIQQVYTKIFICGVNVCVEMAWMYCVVKSTKCQEAELERQGGRYLHDIIFAGNKSMN
jgi:hypothetical protein